MTTEIKTIEIAHSWKGGEKQNITKEDYIKAFTSHMTGFTGLYFGFGEIDEDYYHEATRLHYRACQNHVL